jgi:hypothetical protein
MYRKLIIKTKFKEMLSTRLILLNLLFKFIKFLLNGGKVLVIKQMAIV